jgi:hypothetical protein
MSDTAATPPPPPATGEATEVGPKPWFKRWWGIGLIAFFALMLIGVLTGGGDDTSDSEIAIEASQV